MRNPPRMWAGRERVSVSSYVGRKGGSFFAFHPVEMVFLDKKLFCVQREPGYFEFGSPQCSFTVPPVPDNLTWKRPIIPVRYLPYESRSSVSARRAAIAYKQ